MRESFVYMVAGLKSFARYMDPEIMRIVVQSSTASFQTASRIMVCSDSYQLSIAWHSSQHFAWPFRPFRAPSPMMC